MCRMDYYFLTVKANVNIEWTLPPYLQLAKYKDIVPLLVSMS